MRDNANHRRYATHYKPETKKTGDSSNNCVCLHRSLKLLTDDQVTSLLFICLTQNIILSCVI